MMLRFPVKINGDKDNDSTNGKERLDSEEVIEENHNKASRLRAMYLPMFGHFPAAQPEAGPSGGSRITTRNTP